MKQKPIIQRVKFLSEALADSIRAFGIAIGERQTTTSNYITGRNKPSTDFLEKIIFHFRNVNAHWLLTGEGEPFKEGEAPTQNQTNISGNKNIVASCKGGKAILNNYSLADCEKERDSYKTKLDNVQAEIQSLRNQLPGSRQGRDARPAAGGFNRPN